MSLEFRLGKKEDLDEICALVTSAIENMNRQNIPQWDEIYPNREVLAEDIERCELTVGVLDEKIAVIYVINKEHDPLYATGKWKYTGENWRVLHRLCVNPAFQNQSIGRKTMDYLEQDLKEKGVESIRLDAFTLNPFAIRLYEKRNYHTVGEVNFRKGRFYLMEKTCVL